MKIADLLENVAFFNRKLKGKMTASEFLLAVTDKEHEEIAHGENDADGANLHDMVVSYAKVHYPAVEIEHEEDDVPNHAKELRVIDDDGTDTGWKKNSEPLEVVK